MDAFLSKPFQEEELVSLMRLLGGVQPECFRPALLAELATLFLEETPQSLAAIDAALAASDALAVERFAHRLQGSLLTLSAERAAKFALTLETMARTGSPAECEAVLGQLATELARLTPELEALAASVKSR